MDSMSDEKSDATAWARRMNTPWGHLQSSLLRRRLLRWLGTGQVGSVLDVGCGLGDLAAAVAPVAVRVTCVDRSPSMLVEARLRLSSAQAIVRFECRDLDDGLHDLGTHDLVIAHNVVDYSVEPRGALDDLAARVGPGGRLSLCFGNGAAYPLRHAVITHDFAEALRLTKVAEPLLPGPCGQSIRLRRSTVQGWLEDAGLSVLHVAGVRVLVDLLPNGLKTEATLPALEELEYELGDRIELVDAGALIHLVAERP